MQLTSFQRWSVFAGFALQGPLLAYMAALPPFGYLLLLALSLGIAFWSDYVLKKNPTFHATHWLMMLSFSNIGMWLGWMADFEFLPLLREGVCLCGCACSPLGTGAAFHCPWMYAGMYIGALPAMLLKNPKTKKFCRHNILGCLAMGPGMMLGTYLLSHLPIQQPILHFFLTASVMLIGMVVAMFTVERLTLAAKATPLLAAPADESRALEK